MNQIKNTYQKLSDEKILQDSELHRKLEEGLIWAALNGRTVLLKAFVALVEQKDKLGRPDLTKSLKILRDEAMK